MNKTSVKALVESSIMIAFATVLSMIKILEMPYAGSITPASMLPILILAYRHGTKTGLLSGFVYAAIQFLLGASILSYVTTWYSALAVILLDYIIAFAVLGLGGIFRKFFRSQSIAMVAGALFTGTLRFICHVISGATVWAGLSIPTSAVLINSIAYNATYMLPEILVLAFAAFYVGEMIDFRTETITRVAKRAISTKLSFGLLAGGSAALLVGAVFDVCHVFFHIQGDGAFDVSGAVNINWILLLCVTLVSVALFVGCLFARDRKSVV